MRKKLFLLLPIVCLCGCLAYMQDDAKFVVSLGTSLTFETIGPKETDDSAKVGVDFQEWVKKPLVEWVIDSDGDGEADMSADTGLDGTE